MDTGSLDWPQGKPTPALANSCQTSPLLLAELLQRPEPGPELLLGLYFIILSSLLQLHDLLHYLQFLGPEGERVQTQCRLGAGNGAREESWVFADMGTVLPLIPSRPYLGSEMSIDSPSSRKLSLMPSPYLSHQLEGSPTSVIKASQ